MPIGVELVTSLLNNEKQSSNNTHIKANIDKQSSKNNTHIEANKYKKQTAPLKTKKILIQQYYEVKSGDTSYNIKRQKELDECLLLNLKNTQLDEVHLLTEIFYPLLFVPTELKYKIKQTIIGKRLDYETAFEYYNKHESNNICILSNADIFTDESVELLDYFTLDETFLALTRYEYNDESKTALLAGMEHRSKDTSIYPDYNPTVWTQDAWIWKMHKVTVNNCNFCLGVYSCDNRLAHFIIQSGYKIYNPSYLISISHYDRMSIKNINGDIFKGEVSSKRDPAPEDHGKYRAYLVNSNESIDTYTKYTILRKDDKKGYIYNLFLEKSVWEIPSLRQYEENNYIEYTFDKPYMIRMIDICGKENSKSNYAISYISLFRVSYFIDNVWKDYPFTFNGLNRANGNFIKRNYVNTPFLCIKIRIHVLDYVGKKTLNARFFGDAIKSESKGPYQIVYYDNNWQKPVITEYNMYKLIKSQETIPYNYFAYPWASLVDDINHFKKDFEKTLTHLPTEKTIGYFTIVQHIRYKMLFSKFKDLNIKYIFASHYTQADNEEASKLGLLLFPFPLYAVYKGKSEDYIEPSKRKYLASFIGNYEKYYLTNIREAIFNSFSKREDCFIKKRDKWHYHNMVYSNTQTIDEQHTEEYINVLKESKFSLCPSGSGPNSIRLWESLSFGSIPVILADTYVLPNIKNIDWTDYVIIWKEARISELYDYLKGIPLDEISTKSKRCLDIFKTYFTDNMQYKIINDNLNNIL